MGVVVMRVWNLLVLESGNSFDFYAREKSVLVRSIYYYCIYIQKQSQECAS